jgi:glycerophosphoryl diester phosphodiesterase
MSDGWDRAQIVAGCGRLGRSRIARDALAQLPLMRGRLCFGRALHPYELISHRPRNETGLGLPDRDRVLNIAHRGASGRFPENTIRAFAAAIEAGAQMCELDVQRSRDGAVVVIHDDTVDRTTDGRGAVSAMTLYELKRLDAGVRFGNHFKGERIPMLDEVFALTDGRCGLNIEIKSDGVEREFCHLVCRTITSHGALATAMVSSFDWNALAIVRDFEPRIRIGLLASRSPLRLLNAAFEMSAESINPKVDIVTEELCVAAHKRNLNVYTWTVDEPAQMRQLIALGVEGIMTNYPERLRELMG